MENKSNLSFFDTPVLGHPQGLFVLFFTEMWERFSYYGMRALLVLFLISSLGEGGWNWSFAQASALYTTYTSMVYLTPILGGYLADKYLGSRNAVIIGTILMTFGHVSMALEFSQVFLFIGIGLLIVGNGFFKPNITSMISNMYKDFPEKKDGAYTIFYMGVNGGSFLGILLCGYLGEKVGWSYGFGLAGVFMLLGMLQFYFSKNIFGDIGSKPKKEAVKELKMEFEGDRLNPFTRVDKILITICASAGLFWIINDPISKVTQMNFLKIGDFDFSGYFILSAALLFLFLLGSRILRYPRITMNKMWVIVIFAACMVLFNTCFEQAGGSMTLFAKKYTGRILSGNWATGFITMDIIITVVPIVFISWVLFLLLKRTFRKYVLASLILISSFLMIWGIVFWKINRDLSSKSYLVQYEVLKSKEGEERLFTADAKLTKGEVKEVRTLKINEVDDFKKGSSLWMIDKNLKGDLKYIANEKAMKIEDNRKIKGEVIEVIRNEIEVQATWFGILNSLFIIMLAPLVSKLWESRLNPPASVKYGVGLILLGIGFAALGIGSLPITKEMDTASVSMIWLSVAYLFHTLGELCISPVSLSYVSKLVPGRMIALMFGVWYIALAIGNKLAGTLGGQIEEMQKETSLSSFFWMFTLIPVVLGCIAIAINPVVKKLMHGVK